MYGNITMKLLIYLLYLKRRERKRKEGRKEEAEHF
jgi:hypothetical protein